MQVEDVEERTLPLQQELLSFYFANIFIHAKCD
jgi:hypothetical protein